MLSEEEKLIDNKVALDMDMLKEVLQTSSEFTEADKENLQAEILRQKKEELENKCEMLRVEHDKQKDILTGMRERKASKEELKVQQQAVKKSYDTWHRYTVSVGYDVPQGLYELLLTDLCSKVQKIWLITYCYNGGNPITACNKANVPLRSYRKWLRGESEGDRQFRDAKDDIDLSYADIAEMTLKDMARSKNSAAVIFYLRNRHEDYKDAQKQKEDNKKQQNKKLTDYSKVRSSDKKASFEQFLNV